VTFNHCEIFKSIKQKRTKIIVPYAAHGTNSASAAFVSFRIVPLKSESDGSILPEKLKEFLTPEIAEEMARNPILKLKSIVSLHK
jgi:glycine dehydrogenase subunit 2